MTEKRLRIGAIVAGLTLGATGVIMLLVPGAGTTTAVGVILLGSGWAVLALVAVSGRHHGGEIRQLRTELRAHDERELDRTTRILTAIDTERAKESRHEYHMEQSLERLETRLGELSARTADEGLLHVDTDLDVLFVTSNGAGLGHVTRLLAIAQNLDEDTRVEFLTLSSAYRTLADSGVVVHYFPSADAARVPPRRWNRTFTRYFSALVRERAPRVVVFDGTWVYHGLTDVCRGLGIPLVWVQRGNWKKEVDEVSVQRRNAVAVADEVIVPGDFAVEESIDVGPEITPARVGPITLLDRSQVLDRAEALSRLGLDPAERFVLVNLGGGTLGEADDIARAACEAVARLGSPWRAVLVRSPLARPDECRPGGAVEISAYPVASFARAFEFVIAAAGYNTVQEAVSLGIPTLLVPNQLSVTDDQVARARGAAASGWALMALDAAEVEASVKQLADDDRRNQIHARLSIVKEASGAEAAAEALMSIVARSRWTQAADRIGPSES